MKARAMTVALCVSILVTSLGAYGPARAAEIVEYDEIPRVVLATARQRILDSDFGVVTRELGDDGRPVYRFFYTDSGGGRRIMIIGADGELIVRRRL